MPVLPNPRHELFAQEIAKGATQRAAYRAAGYEGTDESVDANAARLIGDDKVASRVTELQEAAARATGVTMEAVVSELSKIAFVDIRKAVRWGRSPLDTKAEESDPNGLNIYPVELVPSSEMDADTAVAVSEVSLTQTGVKIKMHDKRAALVDLGKYLGLFKDRVEHTGKDGEPIKTQDVTDPKDLARRTAFLLALGAKE